MDSIYNRIGEFERGGLDGITEEQRTLLRDIATDVMKLEQQYVWKEQEIERLNGWLSRLEDVERLCLDMWLELDISGDYKSRLDELGILCLLEE